MKPEREFTLAMGASIIAASIGLLASNLNSRWGLLISFLIVGILFVLHATGTLQFLTKKFLLYLSRKEPAVGIISDIQRKDLGSSLADNNDPDHWLKLLSDQNINAKLIKFKYRRTRWFLQRFTVVINPFGMFFPELDEEGTVLNLIFSYVENGGNFANISELPLYYAFDINKKTVLNPLPYLDFYIQSPTMIYDWKDFPRVQNGVRPSYFFYQDDWLFTKNEFMRRTNFLIQPVNFKKTLARTTLDIKMAIPVSGKSRAYPIDKYPGSGIDFSPIFRGMFGRGEFLISLPSYNDCGDTECQIWLESNMVKMIRGKIGAE